MERNVGSVFLKLFRKTKKRSSELFSHGKTLELDITRVGLTPSFWIYLSPNHLTFSAGSTWLSFPFTSFYLLQHVRRALLKDRHTAFILHWLWLEWLVTGFKKLSELQPESQARGWEKRGLFMLTELSSCSSHLPGCRDTSGSTASIPDSWSLPQVEASRSSPNRSTGSLETPQTAQSITSQRDEQALITNPVETLPPYLFFFPKTFSNHSLVTEWKAVNWSSRLRIWKARAGRAGWGTGFCNPLFCPGVIHNGKGSK